MPSVKRIKTDYPGVYFIWGTSPRRKPEKIYYIRYRRNGKAIDEKAGRQSMDGMTPARAATLRAKRIEGKDPSNAERREQDREEKKKQTGKWTLTRLWEKYLEDRPDLKGKKFDGFRFEKYMKPQYGNKEPRELLPLDVDRLRLKVLKGKSPQTVKLTLSLLQRLSRFGARKKLCDPLPFNIDLPKVDNIKTEDLTEEQLVALLKAIDADTHPQAGAMMKLALFTGMRRGEMFKLTWKDVDFERGFINIVNPKGGQSQTIPLNDAARDVLLSLKGKKDSPYVFPGRGGGQRTDLHKITRKIADNAELPKTFRPLHGLRHVYASMLASSGEVDMYHLQRLLTHKDPRMTQRYAHLRDEALKRASNLVGQLVMAAINNGKEKAGQK